VWDFSITFVVQKVEQGLLQWIPLFEEVFTIFESITEGILAPDSLYLKCALKSGQII
jgi:hypothetical protein